MSSSLLPKKVLHPFSSGVNTGIVFDTSTGLKLDTIDRKICQTVGRPRGMAGGVQRVALFCDARGDSTGLIPAASVSMVGPILPGNGQHIMDY